MIVQKTFISRNPVHIEDWGISQTGKSELFLGALSCHWGLFCDYCPGVRPWARALGWFGACLCFAQSSEKLFCEFVDDPWSFLDEFRWVLISFPLFFKGYKDFAGHLGAAGPPPVLVVPLAFV